MKSVLLIVSILLGVCLSYAGQTNTNCAAANGDYSRSVDAKLINQQKKPQTAVKQ